MTKSILNLPPILQEVWRDVYASVIAGIVSSPHGDTVTDDKAEYAEEEAWEAVRRANGGEVPGDSATPSVEHAAYRKALLWFADEGHYEGTHKRGYGFVDACGLSEARRALGLRWDREDGTLMPLEEALALDGNCKAPAAFAPHEPTSDDMVEALAPIVAEAHGHGPSKSAESRTKNAAMKALRLEPSESWADHDAHIAIASWKAARAWGKK